MARVKKGVGWRLVTVVTSEMWMRKETDAVGAVVGASKERCSVQEIETVGREPSANEAELTRQKKND